MAEPSGGKPNTSTEGPTAYKSPEDRERFPQGVRLLIILLGIIAAGTVAVALMPKAG